MVVIVWYWDLPLPVQSVPITTKVEFKPHLWQGVLDTRLCDEVCQ